MMDHAATVPVTWMFTVIGILLAVIGGSFTWWLRQEWSRNWVEHKAMKDTAILANKEIKDAAAAAHKELDKRIDTHHQKIDHHLDRIHTRIDWIITHGGLPKFPEDKIQAE